VGEGFVDKDVVLGNKSHTASVQFPAKLTITLIQGHY
jgi:hypothetical protein